MIIERLVKTLLVFFLALFCLSVAIDNVIDYQINLGFVKHIMSMDTMRPGFEITLNRSISNDRLHSLAYHFIIATEFIAGFIGLFSAIKMLMNIRHDRAFITAKRIYLIAAALMISLWYFGFNIVAANWFYMWANINGGMHASYQFSIFILLSMIYVMQRESKEE